MADLIIPGIDSVTKRFANPAVVTALVGDPRIGQALVADDDFVGALASDSRFGASFGPGGSVDVATRGFSHTEDNTARFDDLLAELKISGRRLLLSDGVWPGQVTITDASALFDHNSTGFVGHMKGKHALVVDHTMGVPITVSDVRHVYLDSADTGNPDGLVGELTVSRANLGAANPQRGDAYRVYSDDYFKDAAKDAAAGGAGLGAADFNGAGLKTYTATNITVLGVGIDVTDIAGSGGIRQGHKITGALSGATASVQSSVLSSTGQRVAILADVALGDGGHFLPNENLIVDNITAGSISTRGAFIVTSKRLKFQLATNVRMRKLRTDLEVDLDGFRSVAVGGDIDEFVGKDNRKPAIRLNTTVGVTGVAWVKTSWKHGVESAGGYLMRAGVRMDKGPAHAEDYEGGWSYAWQEMGACSDNELTIYARNVRHAFTTNTRPKTSPLTEYEYIRDAGVAHDTVVRGSAFNCLDAPWDTHAGSVGITFIGCYANNSAAGGRSQARVAAYQMRGFANKIIGGTVIGFVDGVRDVSTLFPPPFNVESVYSDIHMSEIFRTGYNLVSGGKGDQSKGKNRIKVIRPWMDFTQPPSFNNTPSNPNDTVGIHMDYGDIEIVDPTVEGMLAGIPGLFGVAGSSTARPDSVLIRRGQTDFTDASGAVRGWTIQSVAPIPYFGIYDHKFKNGGASIVRVGAQAQTIYADDNASVSQSNTIPFALAYTPEGATAAGTFSITATKETGSVINAQATWPGATLAAGAFSAPFTVAVTGASLGDYTSAVSSNTLPAGVVVVSAWVSNTDVATVLFQNTGTTEQVVPSKTIRVRVEK